MNRPLQGSNAFYERGQDVSRGGGEGGGGGGVESPSVGEAMVR